MIQCIQMVDEAILKQKVDDEDVSKPRVENG